MLTKDSVAWRLTPLMEGRGALSSEDVANLGIRHGFPLSDIENLSNALSIALDPARYLVRDESKEFLRDKAVKEAQALAAEMAEVEETLALILARSNRIVFKNPFAHVGSPNPAKRHLDGLDATLETMAAFREFLSTMAREQLLSMRDMPDKRLLRDEHLRQVCFFIFSFWREHGRNLSYTTDPGTSVRGGALVDFVNGVVACISDPPGQLGGEAIKTQIEYFKAREDRNAAG